MSQGTKMRYKIAIPTIPGRVNIPIQINNFAARPRIFLVFGGILFWARILTNKNVYRIILKKT